MYANPFTKNESTTENKDMSDIHMTEIIVDSDKIKENEKKAKEIELAQQQKQAELKKAKAEISKKEKELHNLGLKERDIQIKKREAEIAILEAEFGPRLKNWPHCYPIIKHYPKDDIPPNLQKMVSKLHKTYLALYFLLGANIIGVAIRNIETQSNGNGISGQELGLSAVYYILVPFLAFITWYYPAYKATKKNSAINYLFFFLFNFIHTIFLCYLFIGFKGYIDI